MEDTIVAISTPYGMGGIGIVRMSGVDAFKIAERVFKSNKDFNEIASHTINYGKIINSADKSVVDEVLLSKMVGPATFTREDVIEINCHGGITVTKMVMEILVSEGARIAEPGEFTKRSFLNGRIDLSQAEAVIDLIYSKTEQSSKAALNQLEGKLSKSIKIVRNRLITLLAHIEVNVDYPEYDIEEITNKNIKSVLMSSKEVVQELILGFNRGRLLREGASVVITGKPNVGKSSLLNYLVGAQKAIVTEIPGTTRDLIEEFINVMGIPIRIIDTAGIHDTESTIEQMGIRKAQDETRKADLVLLVVDGSQRLDSKDLSIIESIKDKKTIVVINKTDIASRENIIQVKKELDGLIILETSVLFEQGVNEIFTEIIKCIEAGSLDVSSQVIVTNIRHKELLDKAKKSIDDAISAVGGCVPVDLISIDVRLAAEYLGMIIGESVSEDVIKEIFHRFCIGK